MDDPVCWTRSGRDGEETAIGRVKVARTTEERVTLTKRRGWAGTGG
jgi:hypothetical protein